MNNLFISNSINVIIFAEKDKNGDVLWAWTYPSISESRKAFVNRKYNSLSDQNNSQSFACVRHDKTWFYIFCQDVSEHDELPKVPFYKTTKNLLV